MLILTRRIGEALKIGNDVTVTVTGVKGNQVRIGIEAPKSVEVHREEVYQRSQNENNLGLNSSVEFKASVQDHHTIDSEFQNDALYPAEPITQAKKIQPTIMVKKHRRYAGTKLR